MSQCKLQCRLIKPHYNVFKSFGKFLLILNQLVIIFGVQLFHMADVRWQYQFRLNQ